MTDRHVVVVGSGLAGLAAAATVREFGIDVVVHEAAAEIGGATRESAGWIWRYRDRAAWRRSAPTASATVIELVHAHLDDEIEWLTSLGVELLAASTSRAATVGVHVEPEAILERLHDVVGAGNVCTGSRITTVDPAVPTILAAGGYAGDFTRIAEECGAAGDVVDAWVLRPTSAARGDGIVLGTHAGGSRPHADGECLVRITLPEPDRIRPVLSAVSELLVPAARLVGRDGSVLETDPLDWSGARRLREFQVEHGAGCIELGSDLLAQSVHSGVIGDIVDRIERDTDCVERLPDGTVRIEVRAGITHTWCGLDVRSDAAVVGATQPLFAAGCDAAGSGHGGTASGLAQALVLGRRAGAAAARAAGATDRRHDPR
jgi:hypothetical protein